MFNIFFFLELFCGDIFETTVTLSAILFQIKSPVSVAAFLTTFLKTVLSGSVADCIA